MIRRLGISLSISIIVAFGLLASYAPEASAQYKISSGVLGSGGNNLTSTHYGVRGTAGQAVIGTTSGDTLLTHHAGFWYNRGTTVTGIRDTDDGLPKYHSLDQNYPNPFNPTTTIRFALPRPSRVRLRVYDVAGRVVATLIDQDMGPGIHKTEWNASNVASGIYFYRIQTQGFVRTKKLVLLK